jgi:glycosyltransferase involved in cell wall biosynthesis
VAAPRLAVDVQATQNPDLRDRGLGRYVTNHVAALAAAGADVRALFVNPTRALPSLDVRLEQIGRTRPATATAFRALGDLDWHYVTSPFELDAPIETVLPPFVRRSGTRVAVTLYDLIPFGEPERYLPTSELRTRYRARLEIVRSADAVLCISDYTRAESIDRLGLDPATAVSIGAGVDRFFSPGPAAGTRRPFILSVTGDDSRKNTERLIDAYARLPRDVRGELQLVIVCSVTEGTAGRWRERAGAAGVPDDVVLAGHVSDDTLRDLYRGAELFVFPSLNEGFGLPAAEAAACGCVTITSSATSVPEVLDLREAEFDAADVDAMAERMTTALTDTALRERLRARGLERAAVHTWENVARRTLDALGEISRTVASTTTREISGARARLRVALVTPLPPVMSGVANYTARLAPSLCEHADVDVFATTGSDVLGAHAFGFERCFPIEALGRLAMPSSYDHVVYVLGNSANHHELVPLIESVPGVLWLHEVRFPGFWMSYALAGLGGDPREYFTRALRTAYGDRAPTDLLGDAWSDHDALLRHDIGLTYLFTRHATGVILHSELAAQMLAADQPPGSGLPAYRVIPLAVPSPPGPPGDRRRREEGLLISVGLVSPVKCPDVLIDALVDLRTRWPTARLVFIGPVEAALESELRARASTAGLDAAVDFTGEVSDAELWDWLGRASCALQVRRTNFGETSSAIIDCVVAGLPVVANVASAADLGRRGVIEFIDGAAIPPIVARRVDAVLGAGPEERAERARAQQAFVEETSMAAVGHRVVEFLQALSESSTGSLSTSDR